MTKNMKPPKNIENAGKVDIGLLWYFHQQINFVMEDK